MRIGSQTRDRLGMACATGAVACLASLIVRVPHELPVQRGSWEQELFGDLAAPVAPATPQTPAETTERLAVAARQADRTRDEPILVDVMPNSIGITPAVPLDVSSMGSQPRFIQPVRFQQSDNPPTAWLSGGIELLNDEPTPENDSGLRYFPDARFKSSR